MANLNRVMLIGNLTRDIEIKYTPKGSAIGSGSLAVNRKWKDDGGQSHEEVTYIDFEVWGKRAEVMKEYTGKGKPIYIEGRLKLDQWEDKSSGDKKTKLKVVVEDFQFLGSGDKPKSEPASRPTSRPAAPRPSSAPDTDPDDDIPF